MIVSGFASVCRGAIVSMPVVAVTPGVRVRAYLSTVIRRGGPPTRTLRVAVYDGERLRVLMVRGADGWYK